MNIKQYISDLDISNGDTKRTNCPVCGGVKTFTATNNMGQLMWNCYKAGCSVSGGSRVHLTTDDIRNSLGSTAQETLGQLLAQLGRGVALGAIHSSAKIASMPTAPSLRRVRLTSNAVPPLCPRSFLRKTSGLTRAPAETSGLFCCASPC